MSICTIQRTVSARLPTVDGEFQLVHYANAPDRKEHLALVIGDLAQQHDVLVRVHSECFTGDVLGSQRCDCGEQLQAAMQRIAAEGRGVLIYLRQEGRGIGLQKKLEAYNLQDQGHDTVDANLLLGHQADERTYEVAVAILRDLGIASLRLLTNNPSKLEQLRQAGLTVTCRVPIEPTIHAENRLYLETKVQRMRHLLALPTPSSPSANGAETHGQDTISPTAVTVLLSDLTSQAVAYHATHGLPFVTLSYAQSIDGSIAAASGAPLRISGDASMRFTHMLRATHDAILVGVGTVLADDPRLTVRLAPGIDPQPVILDTHLRTPVTARCLHNPRSPWLVTAADLASPLAEEIAAAGAALFSAETDARGQIALLPLLRRLGDKGIRSIMVEGGAAVLQSFLAAQLAQAAIITIAPFFVGGLPALAGRRNFMEDDATIDSNAMSGNGVAVNGAAVNRTARVIGDAGASTHFPRLNNPKLLQLGDDMICYGHFVKTE